jgi:hypothetical protein
VDKSIWPTSLSESGHRLARMTLLSNAMSVYGETLHELLPALAAVCGRPARQGDMLSLSLALPPSTGGSVRRALLRAEAELLRREADSLGEQAPVPMCRHCREAQALLVVAAKLQRVARSQGVNGRTIAERALLLGQFSSTTSPCCAGTCGAAT